MTNDSELNTVAAALAALGHPARLDLFRLLVKAGRDGLIVSDIAVHLAIPASTLAHHLRSLVSAGLVQQTKRGREVVNHIDFDRMDETLAFLTRECCAGVPSLQDQEAGA